MCSPSALIRVNYLVMRYLHFRNARGDLQEGHFTLPDATCLSFRAQNRHFCALLPSETPVFGHFEHKIEVFVSETAIFPWFWPLPSTKSRFLCAFALRNPRFLAFRAQNRGFCALLPASFFPMAPSASSKPHSAKKRTPVWLAIWRIWAGFANSQHRDAALATPNNICAYSSLLPH